MHTWEFSASSILEVYLSRLTFSENEVITVKYTHVYVAHHNMY